MCTCNSEKLLPISLKRIDQVIPSKVINRKFIVDDFSSDRTVEIAEKFGWEIFRNRKKGLHNAQQYAFLLVNTDYCASFEHDLYLSENWFPHIPNLVVNSGFDVAQGIRIRDTKGFRELDIYDNNHRKITSEDNTFYSMKFIRNNSTTPNLHVDKKLCSLHLRGSTKTSLRHGYYIYRMVNDERTRNQLKALIKSPVLSLKVVKETKSFSVLTLYPLERIMIFSGALAKSMHRN
jgi:glycosyltransferase involved in cell wall biosynthesis